MAKGPKEREDADAPRRGRPPDPAHCAQRREEILEAAAQAFAQRGFAGTDVQEVADAAGIGKGTVYRYLPSKRDLFLAALDRKIDILTRAVDAAVADAADPLDRIRLGVHAYLEHFDAHPELVELIILERAVFKDRHRPTYFRYRDEKVGQWVAVFRDLARAGRIRAVSPERVTDVIGDALYGTIFTNYFAGRRRSFRDQAEDLLDVVLHGILPDPSARARRRASRKGAKR